MKPRHLIPWALSTLLMAAACNDPAEFARFEADDTSGLPACAAEQFPFEPTLLSARVRNDRVGLFLQTTPDVKSRYDEAYIEIYDPDAITVGEPIELSVASYPPPPARGKMGFFSSCAFQHHSLELRGQVIFESFEPTAPGVVAGRLEDGQGIDPRTGDVIVDNLTGSWNFVVRRGPPYEEFYAAPERP